MARYILKQDWISFGTDYTIRDAEGRDAYVVDGRAFSRHGRPVAAVSKRWFSWTDTYGIDVADGEDDVLVLASAVVIDLCGHQDRK